MALVGPTGVGKTTTTAKLAAHFRLHEHRRVGLITVDTYRIAAVEQLRTYADIIDLPMEVASTPDEMRQAIGRLADLDLILMDTAGRSPRDEVQIQELKSLLVEAQPDEVHLVLSCASGADDVCREHRALCLGGGQPVDSDQTGRGPRFRHIAAIFAYESLAAELCNGRPERP